MSLKNFTRLKNPTSWRKISIAAWGPPNDPTVYGNLEVEATQALDFIKAMNEKDPSLKITINHIVAKALATTLKKFPDLNGIIRWRRIYLRNSIDLFLQVAIKETESTADLSGVKIESCDSKSLPQIAQELKDLGQKVREKKDPQFRRNFQMARFLPPLMLKWILKIFGFLVYDLGLNLPRLGFQGDPFGSAMITNVGSLGLPAGFAALFPPGRCPLIVCVGTVTKKPWVVEDQVRPRPVLDLGISFDHRMADGVTAARMMKAFKEIMENPHQSLGTPQK